MPYRPAEREYHTQLGWWFMTHERAGAGVGGAIALALLAGDLTCVATRWGGLGDTLDQGFLLGLGALVAMLLAAKALGLDRPIGPDRGKARLRARTTTMVFVIAMWALFALSGLLGGHALTGTVLGELAALLGLLAIATVIWVVRPWGARRGAWGIGRGI